MTRYDGVLQRLRADLHASPAEPVKIDLVTVTRGEPGGDWDEWVPAGESGPVLVLVLGANLHALAGSGDQEVLREAAEELQQLVIDTTGAPWPVDSESGSVLQPETDQSGEAVWASASGTRKFPIGSLAR